MDDISAIMAFSAGLLSFLSPCVLPLVPAYIGYLTGAAVDEINSSKQKMTVLYKSLFFVIGFSVIFLIMGASVSSVSKIFKSHHALFRILGGLLIIVFGMHTAGIFKIKFLYSEKRLLSFPDGNKNIGPALLGMAFAAGWTPCIGPVLSSILIYAGNMKTFREGLLLLLLYSCGMAVPFILAALTVESFSSYFKRISGYLPLISAVSGILLIFMGLMVIFNKFSLLSRYLSFIDFFNF